MKTEAPPVAEKARTSWRSGQNFSALQAEKNFGIRKRSRGSASVGKSAENIFTLLFYNFIYADVAELADALDSGSSGSNTVWVQVPSSAPF